MSTSCTISSTDSFTTVAL